jgi:hypothetical protein
MRTRRAVLTAVPSVHFPLARLALCLDCEACFEIGAEQCPACGSETWSPLSRFIGDVSDKASVRAVRALVEEMHSVSGTSSAQHLLIVSRTQPKLFETLRRELGENPTIVVILDRRGPGPRPGGQLSNRRQRNVDHQIRALGWAVVRADARGAGAFARNGNGSH